MYHILKKNIILQGVFVSKISRLEAWLFNCFLFQVNCLIFHRLRRPILLIIFPVRIAIEGSINRQPKDIFLNVLISNLINLNQSPRNDNLSLNKTTSVVQSYKSVKLFFLNIEIHEIHFKIFDSVFCKIIQLWFNFFYQTWLQTEELKKCIKKVQRFWFFFVFSFQKSCILKIICKWNFPIGFSIKLYNYDFISFIRLGLKLRS